MKFLLYLLIVLYLLSFSQARFWTAIIGQNANCWNSANNLLGMTWTLYPSVPVANTVHVGCSGCNAYLGDTSCDKCLPILCIQKNQDNRTAYPVASGQEFYNGWVGGPIKLSSPIKGSDLVSQAAADLICAQQFGAGYVIGEHHDGYYITGMNATAYFGSSWNWSLASSGGWSFYGSGNYDELYKLQNLTNCTNKLSCQNSFFYQYTTTATPAQWVQIPGNNDFCNACENLTVSQPIPDYCFNNIVVATIPAPQNGCYACVCNPCDKQYYWYWDGTSWHRKPARDDFCKACLTNPLNPLCHGLNAFLAPGPRDPCEGCWCDSGRCLNYLMNIKDASGNWAISITAADNQTCAQCSVPVPPNFCYQSVADIPSTVKKGCVCNDKVVQKCQQYRHYTLGADGTYSAAIDDTICTDCYNKQLDYCFGINTQFTDIPQGINDICLCLQ